MYCMLSNLLPLFDATDIEAMQDRIQDLFPLYFEHIYLLIYLNRFWAAVKGFLIQSNVR